MFGFAKVHSVYVYSLAVCNCLACQWGIIYGITMIVQFIYKKTWGSNVETIVTAACTSE